MAHDDDFDLLEDPTDIPRDEQHRLVRAGLPVRWAELADGPVRGRLPDGWGRLIFRYAGMGPSAALDEVLKVTVGRQSPDLVMLEGGYIDEDFRDEFSHFYAHTYRPLPSRCERLHFFGKDDQGSQRYIGFVVLRPVIGRPVCRTMLAPPPELAAHVSCTTPASATPYGYPLRVRGFPFISQDSQYGTCSHAAIWMIALYFHLRWRRPRFHLSDLAASARQHQDLLPAIPSGGLTPRQITAVLHDLGMPPLIYRVDRKLPPGETVETIACRYLNSRLPVILLDEGESQGHARVLIGYGREDDGRLFFVHHDDQRGPYLKTHQPVGRTAVEATIADDTGASSESGADAGKPPETRSALTADGARPRWQALIVPLPGRIYLAGESAEKTAKLIFEDLVDDHDHLRDVAAELTDGRLRLRTYVTQVAQYKHALRFRRLPEDVVAWHINADASHWLWIVELQDRAAAARSTRCVLGEIGIDATSDDQWPNPLFGNLPGIVVRWPGLGDDIDWANSSQGSKLYRTGVALHV